MKFHYRIKEISKSPSYVNDTDFSDEKLPKAGNILGFFRKGLIQSIAIPSKPSSHNGYSFVGGAFVISKDISFIYP